MSLNFADGTPFATGVVGYDSRPATVRETASRIFLQVEIEGEMTEAALDTGGVYFICNPSIANHLGLDVRDALEEKIVNIRGSSVVGNLHRVNITFFADEGQGVEVDVTAFIPNDTREERWAELPCFLGWQGCLERLRFAVDPTKEQFYFGSSADVMG